MIPFNVSYIRPETVEEAIEAWTEVTKAGNTPLFFAGGTEIVTKARDHTVTADTFIDLKRIPEARDIGADQSWNWFGAAVTINQIVDTNAPELLTRALAGVGDHTVRNSITLGGNIAGLLPYREGILPFLLLDGTVEIAGPDGRRTETLTDVFDKRLRLAKGEFALRFSLPASASEAPVFYARRTRDSRVDYPLITVCLARVGNEVRCAVSGAFSYPVRSTAAEHLLGDTQKSPDERVRAALKEFPSRFVDDMRGSADYRRALLINSLVDGVKALET